MKILVVTTHTPLAWEDGAGAYLTSIANYFGDQGHRVEIIWLRPHDRIRWQKVWRLQNSYSRNVQLIIPQSLRFGPWYVFPAVIWLPAKARMLGRIKGILRHVGIHVGKPSCEVIDTNSKPSAANLQWRSGPTAEQLRFVAGEIRNKQPNLLVANYPWMAPIFDLSDHVRRVIICYDVQHERAALTSAAEAESYSREREKSDLRCADDLWAISQQDAESIKQMAPSCDVKVAPMAINVKRSSSIAEIPNRCLFVGSDNAFNREGAEWLLRKAWPLILEKNPSATLEICGTVVVRPESQTIDRVIVQGPVPDLTPHYSQAALVLVPLKGGSGVKIKVLEAASYGKAIVGTSVAFQSLPALAELCTAVDRAEDFADRVTKLLQSPRERERIGLSLMKIIELQFSPDACYGGLLETDTTAKQRHGC